MRLINRSISICILAICTFHSHQARSQSKPNLIIIQTDEHSFKTLSCYQKLMSEEQAFVWGKGVNVTTPNIDRLANEGAMNTRYYASSPVCTPSRASFVTGLFPQATGAPKNGLHLSKDVATFAQVLKKNGYSTSYVGKWHLAGNYKYQFDIEYNAGFDDNRYMMTGGHAPYFHIKGDEIKGISNKIASKLPENEVVHLTDFFTEKALNILERDKAKPFCLMLSIPDPHTPDYAHPPYNRMFENLDPKMPKTMLPEFSDKRPSWGRSESSDKNEAMEFKPEALKQYFGMVKHIDDKVGEILEFLDTNDLTNNTIVVFTSDHGDMFYEHKRRNKGVPYESSARIPFVIRYPNEIPAGKVIETAYTTVDFAPTILALMGIDNNVDTHGINAVEDYRSPEMRVVSDRMTYYAKNGGWWVAGINNRYKLVLDKNEKPWLLDLVADPDEVINFYNDPKYSVLRDQLQKELFVQMKKYKEPGLINPKMKPYNLK